MKLTLPFPPSVNGYWRAPNRGKLAGRHLVSERGRKYRAEAVAEILEQLRGMPQPVKGDLAVSVTLCPPSRAKRDLDNYFKALFDSVTNAGIWIDDSQIKKLEAEWEPVTKGGRVFLSIVETPQNLMSERVRYAVSLCRLPGGATTVKIRQRVISAAKNAGKIGKSGNILIARKLKSKCKLLSLTLNSGTATCSSYKFTNIRNLKETLS